jgi:Fe-S cluster assembly scaffold protein SufB
MPQINKPDFFLVDHKIKNINQQKGTVLIPSILAWQKYPWTREFFEQKPKLGYFLWVKKSPKTALSSCISLESFGVKQELTNLIIIEPKVKAEIQSICNTLSKKLFGTHIGKSKVIIKKNGFLKIFHQHIWGRKNTVLPQIKFFLEEKASLNYIYKNLASPKKLMMKNKIFLEKKAKADSLIVIEAKNSQIEIDEALWLKKKGSCGNLVLKLVGRSEVDIKAISKIIASGAGRGHLDCQGLLVDRKAKINLIPQLDNQNNQALITHEASIGKIEGKKLEYLQSRGISEKKAIDLIIRGFLEN